MHIGLILLAAGNSRRMGKDKMQMLLCGKTPVEHCLLAAATCGYSFSQIVVTASEADTAARAHMETRLKGYPQVQVIPGGCTRGGSVYLGLKALQGVDIVLIHDVARCLASPALFARCIASAMEKGSGIAALQARDTVRDQQAGILDRERLLLTQTPQAFAYTDIRRAYELAAVTGAEATDDCALYERLGLAPVFVAGELSNQKLTEAEDIPFFEAMIRGRLCG